MAQAAETLKEFKPVVPIRFGALFGKTEQVLSVPAFQVKYRYLYADADSEDDAFDLAPQAGVVEFIVDSAFKEYGILTTNQQNRVSARVKLSLRDLLDGGDKGKGTYRTDSIERIQLKGQQPQPDGSMVSGAVVRNIVERVGPKLLYAWWNDDKDPVWKKTKKEAIDHARLLSKKVDEAHYLMNYFTVRFLVKVVVPEYVNHFYT